MRPKKKTTSHSVTTEDSNSNLNVQLLRATATKHLDTYTDWMHMMFVCINEGISYAEFLKASQRSVHWKEGESEEWVKKNWDNAMRSLHSGAKRKIGTLWQWLKEDDYDRFLLLREARDDFKKIIFEHLNHASAAEYFYNSAVNSYVYNLQLGWFEITPNNTWKSTGTEPPTGMLPHIAKTLQNEVRVEQDIFEKAHYKMCEAAEDEEKAKLEKEAAVTRKKFITAYNKFGDASFRKGMLVDLAYNYLDEDLDTKMDCNVDIFAFEDKLYEIPSGTWRDIAPSDWVCTTTGYPAPTDDSALDEVLALFISIFNKEDTSLWVRKVLASTMIGHNRWEQLYFWTGTGANGKGVLAELMKTVAGGYFYPVDVALFTQPDSGRDKPMPALVEARSARIVMSLEPEGEAKLQGGLLKKLSGGDTVEARGLYSKHITKYPPQFKIFLQTNGIPELSGLDGGLSRRIRVLDFPNRFTSDPKAENERLGDPDIKSISCRSPAWRDATAIMLCRLATEICKDATLDMCDDVREASKEYLDSNNPVGEYLHSHYECTKNPEDYVLSKKLLDGYNSSRYPKPGMSAVKFAQAMAFNGFSKKRIKKGIVWVGLRLPEPEDPPTSFD